MSGSRTIKTLVALLGALTIGTIVLMALETDPIHPKVRSLIAAEAPSEDYASLIGRTEGEFHPHRWNNIVIHSSGGGSGDIIGKSHFVVEQNVDTGRQRVRATDLWRGQRPSRHIAGPNDHFNTNSIAICLVGDFGRRQPAKEQFLDLVRLVVTLQCAGKITGDHVYLCRDLDTRTYCPGQAFPARAFNACLLRAIR